MSYSQNDGHWKNTLLGYNTSTQYTIGTAGCYVTAIANVCNWAGNNLSPLQINDLAKQSGWFVNGGELNRDDIPALLCSNLGYAGRTNWNGPADMSFFNDASDPNVAYIILIDASPAAGMQTHYTMVWSKPNDTNLEIDDSWDGQRKLLSAYGHPPTVLHSAMKFVKVQPTPAAPPAPTVAAYSVVETYPDGKQVKLNKQPTQLWGMNYHFDYMKDHPVETHNAGEIWTVTNKVHHENGYDYYRRADQVDGFNVLDCDDYIAPLPAPAAPYVPPAAPEKGTPAKKYKVLSTVMWFETIQDAQSKERGRGTLAPKEYYLFDKGTVAVRLGDDNMTPKYWINTKDNVEQIPVKVVPPAETAEPADGWKATKVSFYDDRNRFDNYELQMDVLVRDLDNKGKDFFVSAYKPNSSDNAVLKVYGTVYKDGMKYYLLHHPDDTGWVYWYVIPQANKHTGKPYLLKYTDTYDTTPKAHELSVSELALEGFARLGYKVIDVVKRLRIR